jgi:hypothetical protein
MRNAVTNTVPISKRNLTKVSCERSKRFTHLNIKFSRLIRIGLFAAFNILLIIAEATSRIKNLSNKIFLLKPNKQKGFSNFVSSLKI